MTPEALEEFRNIKALLQHPMVLQNYVDGRKTALYTDASEGTHDKSIPGGLGAVITQVNEQDSEGVCAFVSASLSSAQANHHIVRLEALSMIWVLGKFNDWLSAGEFVWRTDARANKFLMDVKYSTNPAICRYALTVEAYRYTVEWIPGVRMIADTFSRMILIKADEKEAFSLPKIAFSEEMGKLVHDIKVCRMIQNRSDSRHGRAVWCASRISWNKNSSPKTG